MQASPTQTPLRIQVQDASRQRHLIVDDIPTDATVGEVVQQLLDDLGLPVRDAEGGPLSYHALLEREQRHVHATERAGEVLQPGDSLTLHPNIQAGRS